MSEKYPWMTEEKLALFAPRGWKVVPAICPGRIVFEHVERGVRAEFDPDDGTLETVFAVRPPPFEVEETDPWMDGAEAAFEDFAGDDWALVGFERNGGVPFLTGDVFELTMTREVTGPGEFQALLRWLEHAPRKADMDAPETDTDEETD